MTLKCYDSKKIESPSLKALVLQEMVKKGVFMSPGPTFISYSHTIEDIDNTLIALDDICKNISEKISNDDYEKHLEGNMPKTIWTMTMQPVKKLGKSV
jgi:hypothetical protein